MFLKQKIILAIMFIGVCFTAQAKQITELEAGSYKLSSGEKRLCPDFLVSKKESSSKSITVGGLYSFETTNSSYNMESDIDPACRFIEKNKREEKNNETLLTRINEEVCKGKLRSRTISVAVIQRDSIQVRHEIQGAEPYTCVWSK